MSAFKDTNISNAYITVNVTRIIIANATDVITDIGNEVGNSVVSVGKILYNKTYTSCFIGNVAYDGKRWLRKFLNSADLIYFFIFC